MRRHKKSSGADDDGGINMTPMIDIVFQMIIFFVCTVQLEKEAINENIKLAMSPHGPAVEKVDPMTVTIEITGDGHIEVGRMRMNEATLTAVLKKTVSQYGFIVPVVIRGDAQAHHIKVKQVMDACSRVGIWKIKFAATKDEA